MCTEIRRTSLSGIYNSNNNWKDWDCVQRSAKINDRRRREEAMTQILKGQQFVTDRLTEWYPSQAPNVFTSQ